MLRSGSQAMLELTVELLRLFAIGTLPATTVQRPAAAAFKDGWGVDDAIAIRLKNIGAEGRRPQNAMDDAVPLKCQVQAVSLGLSGCACPTSRLVWRSAGTGWAT